MQIFSKLSKAVCVQKIPQAGPSSRGCSSLKGKGVVAWALKVYGHTASFCMGLQFFFFAGHTAMQGYTAGYVPLRVYSR